MIDIEKLKNETLNGKIEKSISLINEMGESVQIKIFLKDRFEITTHQRNGFIRLNTFIFEDNEWLENNHYRRIN